MDWPPRSSRSRRCCSSARDCWAQIAARAAARDVGFQPDRLLTFQLSLPSTKYAARQQGVAFYQTLLESLRDVPGVRDAAVSSGMPFGQGNYTTTPCHGVGQSPLPPDTPMPIDWRIVSPDSSSDGRARCCADGTSPTATDRPRRDRDDRQPGDGAAVLGRRQPDRPRDAPRGRTAGSLTVVGVVGDVKNSRSASESPAMYYPLARRVWPRMDVIVRR